jgi:hypothetical protein
MSRTILLLTLICLLTNVIFSAEPKTVDAWRFRAGLRNSTGNRSLKPLQLRLLETSLREKTGFQELHFDEAGFLVTGNRTCITGGSATARELITATIDGQTAFELEAWNFASQIAFACLSTSTVHISLQRQTRIQARQIQLDFADFTELRGDSEVVSAFDVGFAVLHELVHGVLGLRDTVGEANQLGECDALINRMRRELCLPERQGYTARVQQTLSGTGSRTLAELIFTRERINASRRSLEQLYLRWEAKRVARLTNSAQSSLVRYH